MLIQNRISISFIGEYLKDQISVKMAVGYFLYIFLCEDKNIIATFLVPLHEIIL